MFRSDDSSLTVDFHSMDGRIIADGEIIDVSLGLDPTLESFDMIKHLPVDGKDHGVTADMILLHFKVDADKGSKTLTVTVDGGSMTECIGNEYVLHFCPGEEFRIPDTGETNSAAVAD